VPPPAPLSSEGEQRWHALGSRTLAMHGPDFPAVAGHRRRSVLADGAPARRPPDLGRRHVVIRFIVLNVATLAVLIVLGALLAEAAARREALGDASRATDTLAVSVVQRAIQDTILTGDPQAIAALDKEIRDRVLGPQQVLDVVRVKIWSPAGTILYSNEPRLIGHNFPLDPEEKQALEHGLTEAEISDLTKPENVFERGSGELLEVYRPIWTPKNQVLLYFE
jgi:two-component system, NarL family, sensor kinase